VKYRDSKQRTADRWRCWRRDIKREALKRLRP
jgi:hypothetical protein